MSTLPERLRAETRSVHEQTEHLLYSDALRAGNLSIRQYYHLLLTHVAFHNALERAIDQHPEFFEGYQPETRRKTPWLLADLKPWQAPVPLVSIPVFTNWSPVELLGAAYVGEGSMLGGKTVWHYLQQSPSLQPLLETARFYRGYGQDTGPKWQAFGLFLTRAVGNQSDLVVEAARKAFLTYHALFEQNRAAANNSRLPAFQAASE